MILVCSSAACNCFCFLLIALSVSAYIFASQVVVSVAILDCSPVAYSDVGKGQKNAVRAFGDKDGDGGGGRYDYAEYPAPEFCDDDADGNGAVVGMSLLVMAVCAFLISNTCPEYCFRKRIDLDRYKKIVVEKECGCKIEYDAFEEP